ncbi:hypothetical protein ABZ202_13530 [Streptomyces sp. NPDC006186]|uniref:hypothetical protein n=1 Tax=Streptomyces sp. NPDC006186 TaxID=3155248 RepID=UPI0033B11C91
MSTEARRAPIPPRPNTPPTAPPVPAPRPGDHRTPAPGDRPAPGGADAAPQGAQGRSAASAGTDVPAQGTPGPDAFAAAGPAPQSPPPPPASARFPDTPPPRPGSEQRQPTGDAAPRQDRRPAAPSRPAQAAGSGYGQVSSGGVRDVRSADAGATRQAQGGTPAPSPERETAGYGRTPRGDLRERRPGDGAIPRPAPGDERPTPTDASAYRQTPAPAAARPAREDRAPAAQRPAGRPAASGVPAEAPSETTTRLRPVPADPHPAAARPEARHHATARTGAASSAPAHRDAPSAPAPAAPWSPLPHPTAPDPALSWTAAEGPGSRPHVSFAEPERFDASDHRTRRRRRGAAAAVCLVLGLGLIGGAVTGSFLTGGSGDAADADAFEAAGELWHNVPVDRLFPPTVQGQGAGPGAADRTWTRIAVASDSGCNGAFDPLLATTLAPVGCERLLRATYTDATQSYVTTVGLLFTEADADAMRTLRSRFEREKLADRADLMPRPYAAKGTAAAGFGDAQRASWSVSVLTDAPVVVYAVSGWADGRRVDTPQPAKEAAEPGATTAPAQAGLGNEAQGLADRIERGLRATVNKPTEQPS